MKVGKLFYKSVPNKKKIVSKGEIFPALFTVESEKKFHIFWLNKFDKTLYRFLLVLFFLEKNVRRIS